MVNHIAECGVIKNTEVRIQNTEFRSGNLGKIEKIENAKCDVD